MAELSVPSRELAARLLSELGYDEKITAWEVEPASGWLQCYIYSLKELANFLDAERGGFMHFIDPDDLRAWVRKTLGDEELAHAIAELSRECEACQNSVERYRKEIAVIRPIKELLLARLKQCEEVLGEATKV